MFLHRLASSPKVWQTAAAAQLLLAYSAHADAGKLFDFDLTLPLMVGQFLILMKFLDSKVFTPVGNTMDERAKGVKIIRAALSEKQESRNATASENREILSQGRAAADMYIKSVKKAKMEEVEELVQIEKKAIEAEVAVASSKVKDKIAMAEAKLNEEKPAIMKLIIEKLVGSSESPAAAGEVEEVANDVQEPATVEV